MIGKKLARTILICTLAFSFTNLCSTRAYASSIADYKNMKFNKTSVNEIVSSELNFYVQCSDLRHLVLVDTNKNMVVYDMADGSSVSYKLQYYSSSLNISDGYAYIDLQGQSDYGIYTKISLYDGSILDTSYSADSLGEASKEKLDILPSFQGVYNYLSMDGKYQNKVFTRAFSATGYSTYSNIDECKKACMLSNRFTYADKLIHYSLRLPNYTVDGITGEYPVGEVFSVNGKDFILLSETYGDNFAFTVPFDTGVTGSTCVSLYNVSGNTLGSRIDNSIIMFESDLSGNTKNVGIVDSNIKSSGYFSNSVTSACGDRLITNCSTGKSAFSMLRYDKESCKWKESAYDSEPSLAPFTSACAYTDVLAIGYFHVPDANSIEIICNDDVEVVSLGDTDSSTTGKSYGLSIPKYGELAYCDGSTLYTTYGFHYNVTFQDHDGTVLKTESVFNGDSANPPEIQDSRFIGWDKPIDNIQEDTVVTAQYKNPKLENFSIDTSNQKFNLD